MKLDCQVKTPRSEVITEPKTKRFGWSLALLASACHKFTDYRIGLNAKNEHQRFKTFRDALKGLFRSSETTIAIAEFQGLLEDFMLPYKKYNSCDRTIPGDRTVNLCSEINELLSIYASFGRDEEELRNFLYALYEVSRPYTTGHFSNIRDGAELLKETGLMFNPRALIFMDLNYVDEFYTSRCAEVNFDPLKDDFFIRPRTDYLSTQANLELNKFFREKSCIRHIASTALPVALLDEEILDDISGLSNTAPCLSIPAMKKAIAERELEDSDVDRYVDASAAHEIAHAVMDRLCPILESRPAGNDFKLWVEDITKNAEIGELIAYALQFQIDPVNTFVDLLIITPNKEDSYYLVTTMFRTFLRMHLGDQAYDELIRRFSSYASVAELREGLRDYIDSVDQQSFDETVEYCRSSMDNLAKDAFRFIREQKMSDSFLVKFGDILR